MPAGLFRYDNGNSLNFRKAPVCVREVTGPSFKITSSYVNTEASPLLFRSESSQCEVCLNDDVIHHLSKFLNKHEMCNM